MARNSCFLSPYSPVVLAPLLCPQALLPQSQIAQVLTKRWFRVRSGLALAQVLTTSLDSTSPSTSNLSTCLTASTGFGRDRMSATFGETETATESIARQWDILCCT